MEKLFTPPSVVVGIDGSKAAAGAALWAIDEAISRDIPLRLLYVVDEGNATASDLDAAARKLAAADIAVRYAFTAVEATDKPVKIEVEIAQGNAASTLVRASRSAAMVCVGAVGFNHFQPGRVGSTAAAVAANAHCAVAVVRHHDGPPRPGADRIVVVADESPHNGVVLETALEEARLRNAPLRVITCWQSRFTDIHDGRAVSEGNRRIRAELDRRLAPWIRRYPDIQLDAVAVHGNIVNYLAKDAKPIQLVVVGARDRRDVEQLIGPAGNAALHHSDCSVLVVDRQHL
jgi:nucleotide-binding universal stress UspA family protein